jgi:hypothetical protein
MTQSAAMKVTKHSTEIHVMKKSRSIKWRLAVGIPCAAAITLTAGFLKGTPAGYVAHEWGTFTSVQGGDGALLSWRPLESSRLPGFVYDWNKPGLGRQSMAAVAFTKQALVTLQRLETPVIYFYSDRDETVDVSVNFPKGKITEWYPQAKQIGPSYVPAPAAVAKADTLAHKAGAKPDFTFESWMNHSATKESRALWSHVDILKPGTAAANEHALATDRSGSHYFSARDTDANFLRVDSLSSTNPAPETEKFIFYRGAGSFATPLLATTTRDHLVTITNNGSQALEHLYLLGVRDGAGTFVHIDTLKPGEQRKLALDPAKNVPVKILVEKISQDLAKSLVSAGLYPREAKAMVNTWRDSWFEENGLRVLYILPRPWTDQTLPITMNPAPRELVRVMVGRAEIIPPDQQERIYNAITRSNDGDPNAGSEAQKEFRKLGRFAEPALILALQKATQPAVNNTGWRLMQQMAEEDRAARARQQPAANAPAVTAQVRLQQVQEARTW